MHTRAFFARACEKEARFTCFQPASYLLRTPRRSKAIHGPRRTFLKIPAFRLQNVVFLFPLSSISLISIRFRGFLAPDPPPEAAPPPPSSSSSSPIASCTADANKVVSERKAASSQHRKQRMRHGKARGGGTAVRQHSTYRQRQIASWTPTPRRWQRPTPTPSRA